MYISMSLLWKEVYFLAHFQRDHWERAKFLMDRKDNTHEVPFES
jgi:hypothetical protein